MVKKKERKEFLIIIKVMYEALEMNKQENVTR